MIGQNPSVREAREADTGMLLAEVLDVLNAFTAARCRFWLEGGWGIDALVGRQTRPHRDLDLDVDARDEVLALSVLADLGYTIETDWRPNRVELLAPGRGWVDVHPFEFDENGAARQAALGGGWHEFPKSYFVHGTLGSLAVPCVSATAQRRLHSGYELREVDKHDLAQLDALDPT
jgi:lincosamide nucleotidyltransferase A/C/D/E